LLRSNEKQNLMHVADTVRHLNEYVFTIAFINISILTNSVSPVFKFDKALGARLIPRATEVHEGEHDLPLCFCNLPQNQYLLNALP
jgi:hypothetical protein